MATRIKKVVLKPTIDTESPSYLMPDGVMLDLLNWQPKTTGYGIETVKGYVQYAGGDLATSKTFYCMYFTTASGVISEGTELSDDNGNIAVALEIANITSGSFGGGDAEGYVAVLFYGTVWSGGTYTYKISGSVAGTKTNLTESEYYNGDATDIVDYKRLAWSKYTTEKIGVITGKRHIRGIINLDGKILAFRDNEYETKLQAWVAQSDNTWLLQPGFFQFTGGLYGTDGACEVKHIIHNFDGTSKAYCVTGKDKPFIWDNYGFDIIDTNQAEGLYPNLVTVFNNQLFLYYPSSDSVGGSLLYSAVGDPSDFTTTSLGAGETYINFDVKDISSLVGNKLCIMGDEIHIMSVDSDGNFSIQVYAENTNCQKNSVARLGDLLYLSNKRVHMLSTTNKFGDFEITSITKSVNTMLDEIITSDPGFTIVIPELNQYRLYMPNKHVIVVTFVNTYNGTSYYVTRQYTSHYLTCVSNVVTTDGVSTIYYGGFDGKVYKGETGYTFNNEDIVSQLRSPVIDFGNPQTKKRWRKIALPINLGSSILTFGVIYDNVDTYRYNEVDYDYSASDLTTLGYWDSSSWNRTQNYWATSTNKDIDEIMDIYINGTSPSLAFFVKCTCKGIQKAEFSTLFLHYTNRGRKR